MLKIVLILLSLNVSFARNDLKSFLENKWINDSVFTKIRIKKISILNLESESRNFGQCSGGELIFLNPANLRISIEGILTKDEKHEVENLYVGGSGGTDKIIIHEIKGRKPKIVYEGVLIDIDVENKKESADCPEIHVTVHGSFFNRVGSETGKALLKWDGYKYKLEVPKK